MRLLLSILSIGLSICLSAQEENKWELLQEKDGLIISKQLVQCHVPSEGMHTELLLLKFENTNEHPVDVTWFTDTYRNGACVNCDHSRRDTERKYRLNPKEVITGDCKPGLNIGLEVFSKWLDLPNKSELTKMNLTGLIIKHVKL